MFRLRSKTQLFDGTSNPLQNSNCSTVASATCGLVFTASSKPELNVVCLKDLERDKATELIPPSRKLPLPAPAKHIAVNCDSSILAVALKLNGVPHLQFYAVQSFLTPVSWFNELWICRELIHKFASFRTFKRFVKSDCQLTIQMRSSCAGILSSDRCWLSAPTLANSTCTRSKKLELNFMELIRTSRQSRVRGHRKESKLSLVLPMEN